MLSQNSNPTAFGAVGAFPTPLELAIRFHKIYERLAPGFGYETRLETRVFNSESDNGRLMVAVCEQILGGKCE